MITSGKVSIVGAGDVGSTYAYGLAGSGAASEIVLIDKNEDLMKGQVLDLAHGMPFYPHVQIKNGTDVDYADSEVIVITAGAKQQPGESRINLLKRNARIMESIVDDIIASGSLAVILVVSNPVDILSYIAQKHSGFDRRRIIGSGTVLDSARFRYLLSRHCGVSAQNVHAYILGEHGDSEFAAWSMTHLAGMPIDAYCGQCRKCGNWMEIRDGIETQVRHSAYHIIDYKGATYYGVSAALVRITTAILRNEKSVLTVSTLLDGEYGLNDVYLSVPCLISSSGVAKVIQAELPPQEQEKLEASAGVLRQALDELMS